MNAEQTRIWDYLILNALGITNAKHMNEIARSIGVPNQGTNNDNVRNWIADMVINHGRQIGTSQDGAFIILTDDERENAARFLERNQRADAVRSNGNYIPS
jgi:hypothetical protein